MKAIGIILAGGNHEKMGQLTRLRAVSAMPLGSCYRSVDFAISNLSNSGIRKVAVIVQYNSRSLYDHLSSSKWWDLGSKQGGLFIFSPYQSSDNSSWFRGTADSIHQNLSFLTRSNEPYVIITSGDVVYKADFNELLGAHVDSGADITIVYKELGEEEDLTRYGVLRFNDDNQLIEFEEKPLEPLSNLVSTGIYIISRTLLIKMLEAISPEGRYDIVKDILIRYRKKLNIKGYRFQGYWRAINSVQAYYEANMDFLNKDVRDLFTKQMPYIATKPKDEPPAKYNEGANVRDSLVGSGSILNGYIERSVLFRKVFTGENTSIRNSVIMEGCYIGNHCVVENAILDKEVVLSDGKQIIGTLEEPVILAKGSVV
jgi:glucose-1-phosphate adenylyltransferase